ncbi:RNA polymerase sigma factor [Streptomyces europaeiscabiei]|uniref:RNA polymerase sigma factor n=1 Tax=Streptomyces europaeiscabiei TaxID=146819 RepID=UPI000AF1EAEF|nr:RNA polymerase sigma factor [Streptomyces europaeiscabiei]MDX3831339.1 RNA polymerase sigma factor [Streptomyces europaeiscabiei]
MSTQVNGMIMAGGALESELVARARAGDRTAFAALYTAHRDTVYAFLYNRTRDRNLAEDLTQDVFVRALRRLETFTAPRSAGFAGWLSVIARNIHLDHVKLARTRLEVPVAEMADSDERDRSAEAYALRELDIAEAVETVTAAMRNLTPYQRQCLELRFLEGLTGPETAARLGKDIGAVKTLQFRAMSIMRQTLTAGVAA